MHIVYANGQPRSFEFALTAAAAVIPADATIFATCSGDHVAEQLDEQLFAAITDEEFYEFRALVNEALTRERHALLTARPVARTTANTRRRLWQRLCAIFCLSAYRFPAC